MQSKLITIITVCLNSGETIGRTMESVLSQMDDDMEYIIVDGASVDNTLDIIKSYNDNRVKLISKKDKGIFYAMNKGVKKSTGKWIYFLNSGDWLLDNVLGKIKNILICNDKYDFVYGGIIWHDQVMGKRMYKVKYGISRISLEGLAWGMKIPHQAMFVKKSVFIKNGLFDTKFKIGADWDFTIRGFLSGCRFLRVNVVVANFPLNGVSAKFHMMEYHRVRKKNGFTGIIDFYMIKDVKHLIIDRVLYYLFIGEYKQKLSQGFRSYTD